jgi:hypothetical protein
MQHSTTRAPTIIHSISLVTRQLSSNKIQLYNKTVHNLGRSSRKLHKKDTQHPYIDASRLSTSSIQLRNGD